MKIYVAASSKEIPRARAVMDALEKVGHTITHDWTTSVDMYRDDVTESQLTVCAIDDYYGVVWADCLLLLAPMTPSTGSWVELGLALAANKRVIVAGGNAKQCIFFSHPDVEWFPTDERAATFLGSL